MKRRRGREPSEQRHPSWMDLLAKGDAGFSPRKEVMKRIRAGEVPDEDVDPEQFLAYENVTGLLGVER